MDDGSSSFLDGLDVKKMDADQKVALVTMTRMLAPLMVQQGHVGQWFIRFTDGLVAVAKSDAVLDKAFTKGDPKDMEADVLVALEAIHLEAAAAFGEAARQRKQ